MKKNVFIIGDKLITKENDIFVIQFIYGLSIIEFSKNLLKRLSAYGNLSNSAIS